MAADVEGGTSTGCLSKSPVPWVGESCREGGCARVLCLGLSGPGGKGGGGSMLLYWWWEGPGSVLSTAACVLQDLITET